MTKANSSKPTLNGKAKRQRKSDKVLAMLRRDGGASLTEITKATGWLPHSARAVLTGFRKKGFTIAKSKVDEVTRWTIMAEPAA